MDRTWSGLALSFESNRIRQSGQLAPPLVAVAVLDTQFLKFSRFPLILGSTIDF